jgi:hypothetical protein
MLHTKKSSIEITIGVIEYMASVEYGFNAPAVMSDDPTERDDSELVYHKILKCMAYNTETGENYFVTDQDELNMVEDWVNWEDEFNTL